MPDGVDFTLGDHDGHAIRYMVSMEASFASEMVARVVSDGDYPLLASLWGYRSTKVGRADVASLRADVVGLIKAALKEGADQKIIDKLDMLFSFLKDAERLGLGVYADGP